MDHLMKKRAVTLFWVFIFIFGGIIGHLAYIQVISGDRLSRQAIAQQSQSLALEIPFRGEILDRNLKPLNPYREVWRAAVFPALISDKTAAAALLAGVLGIDLREAENYLSGAPELIPVDLNNHQVGELRRKAITGIYPVTVKLRPRKPQLASHIVGYLGRSSKPGGWAGETGLEAYYDSELQGQAPRSLIRVFLDGRGKHIAGLGHRVETGLTDKDRKDIVLTIDRDIQETVERVLDRAGVKSGAAVVIDPQTGDVLAMASRPDYTLTSPAEPEKPDVDSFVYDSIYNPPSFLNNSLSLYQPGSVFKVIVAAAALEEGVVKPDTLFLCTGEKDELVKCYKEEGHGLITFSQAVAYSCNPTFARVGLKLGAQKLIAYAKKFGLADGGIIGYRGTSMEERVKRIGERYNLVNASLGQWPVQATAVQVASMMAAIANDGMYSPPRLVREIRGANGQPARMIKPGPKTRAVSAETAKIMQSLLEMTTRYGTGTKAWLEPWGSAGKTGSAQVGTEKIDAWFSGYAPVDNPRYVAAILVTDGESGGTTAAPIFREIMQEILATGH